MECKNNDVHVRRTDVVPPLESSVDLVLACGATVVY